MLSQPQIVTGDRLLNDAEVADLLGCSKRQVHTMVSRGDIPRPRKLGRLTRWSRLELERWIQTGCQAQVETR